MEDLNKRGIVQDYLYKLVTENRELLESVVDSSRDYLIDFFGFKTLEKSYLLKTDNVIVERPQYLFMRVVLCLHRNDITKQLKHIITL